jgi:hypothetical protein
VILDAHQLRIELPTGWSGRVFGRSGGIAALHAGNFPIALGDGEFGDRSLGQLPTPGVFVALVEYLPGAGLEAGQGLFAPGRIPRRFDPTEFSTARLAHPRPGQVGLQRFFAVSGRPFCLYVVLSGGREVRRRQLGVLDRVLNSLKISPRR